MATDEQITRIKETLHDHYTKAKDSATNCDVRNVLYKIRRAEEFLTRMDDTKVLSLKQYTDLSGWLDKEEGEIADLLKKGCRK